MTAGAEPSTAATEAPAAGRLGAFVLDRPLDETIGEPLSRVVVAATGAAGTPFAGRTGWAHCVPLPVADTVRIAQAERTAATVDAFRHPGIVPILAAGVAGGIGYVIEAPVQAVRLSERLASDGRTTPLLAVRIARQLADTLSAARQVGLLHGRVCPAEIWLDAADRALLGGFTVLAAIPVEERQPADAANIGRTDDQIGLATTVAAMLRGAAPQPPSRNGQVGRAAIDADSLPGIAERVSAVLGRAAAVDPAARYPTVEGFAAAFGEAVNLAGDDLVAGIWEAQARNDAAMATIMMDLATRYRPDHPDLSLLRLRLRGEAGLPFGPATGGIDRSGALAAATASGGLAVPTEPTDPNAAAIAALLTPPVYTGPPKRRNNPWIVFAAGAFGCVIIFVIVVAVSLSYT